MDISIIIVNYKSWNALSALLESIGSLKLKSCTLETIVVDNCSNDGKIIEFKENFSSVKFFENTGNNGFSNGCNYGASKASGTYLFFLNPDTELNQNALEKLWQSAKENPNFGVVTCNQYNESGKKYNQIRFFPSLLTLFGSFRIVYKIINKKKINRHFCTENKILHPDWTTGAVIFMSDYWFKKCNGWNEKYWLYFEDVDICRRIKNCGGTIALLTDCSILHKHGGASRINIKTKALTKTEVLISQHVYFSENYKGITLYIIQLLLVLSLSIQKAFLAIIGLLFMFIPKLQVNYFIYFNLKAYYWNAILNKTWISPRAIQYKK